MNHLPVEIISSIMQHISEQNDLLSCSLVNQCFYRETVPFLWRCFAHEEAMVSKSIDRLLQQLPSHPITNHVQEVTLGSRWTDAQFTHLMSHIGPQVDKVTISNGHHLSDVSFQQLPRHWPHLTQLHLCYATITHTSMVAIASHCPQLRTLSLSRCIHLTPDMYAPFVQAHPQLENVGMLVDGLIEPHMNEQMARDLAQFTLLTSLTFDGSLEVLTSARWHHLTHLDLNAGGDDACLIPFLQAHPRLTRVGLAFSDMTDATLEAMATCLPHLTYVNLRGNTCITAQGVRRLVCDCPGLAWVQLGDTCLDETHFPQACFEPRTHDLAIAHVSHLDQRAITDIRREFGSRGIFA
ncbi:unnamed protein product [Absidia cylindrospora]